MHNRVGLVLACDSLDLLVLVLIAEALPTATATLRATGRVCPVATASANVETAIDVTLDARVLSRGHWYLTDTCWTGHHWRLSLHNYWLLHRHGLLHHHGLLLLQRHLGRGGLTHSDAFSNVLLVYFHFLIYIINTQD